VKGNKRRPDISKTREIQDRGGGIGTNWWGADIIKKPQWWESEKVGGRGTVKEEKETVESLDEKGGKKIKMSRESKLSTVGTRFGLGRGKKSR